MYKISTKLEELDKARAVMKQSMKDGAIFDRNYLKKVELSGLRFKSIIYYLQWDLLLTKSGIKKSNVEDFQLYSNQ